MSSPSRTNRENGPTGSRRRLRIAAIGDVHFGRDSRGALSPSWQHMHEHADVFLIAGDLTRVGTQAEAEALAAELNVVRVPVVAVLGNHDYQSDDAARIADILRGARVRVLEASSTILEIAGGRVGIAGVKGFGGGFLGACATEFGEPEMKAFIRTTRGVSHALERELRAISDADWRIALLHYAPVDGTVEGEKRQIYPFLGSYLLGEAIDRVGCDIVFHGHAHLGREKAITAAGIPVRNVAQPVIRHAYNVYALETGREAAAEVPSPS